MNETFVSIDVETLGPIPGKHPMIELGAAAYNIEGEVVSTWKASLDQDGWEADPATMKWWHQPAQFQVFQRINEETQNPSQAMPAFQEWLNTLDNLTPVAYPAAFDYMFVYWYMMYYIGNSKPFSFSCLDVKTYVMASLKKTAFRRTIKKAFPRRWFNPTLPHTHSALDDALEQGYMFIQAHRENLGLPCLTN